MRNFYTIMLLLLGSQGLHAQVDTVLHQDFEVMPVEEWGFIPFGDDTDWVNVDADGLNPSTNLEEEKRWFFSEFFYDAVDTIAMDTNYCMASLSWMEGYAAGNRNWLITPPITVDDASYMLYWSSAPFQMPRYMDGYSVRISTNGNDMLAPMNPFTDIVFTAAQMESITGDGESIDPSNFIFSSGYIHADTVSNWDYMAIWAEGDSTLCHGLLQPHSVSLANYVGETIYIAFVHDSDDDYYLALDDVLVTKGNPVGAQEALKNLRFEYYPNPVRHKMNINYNLDNSAVVNMYVTDLNGRIVRRLMNNVQQSSGLQSNYLNVQDLPSGNYNLVIDVNGAVRSELFNKH